MKKPKIKLDKDQLQQFALLHIEKMLLGIIVCLMLLLIYRGLSIPHGLEASKTPQGLVDSSNKAKQYISDVNRWIEVQNDPERLPKFDIVQRVGDVQKPSDALAYMLVNTWSRPDFPKLSPREDPEPFAPINLVVRPVVGAIASYPRNEAEYNDPLFPGKTEEELRKERMKKVAEEKRKKKEADKLGEGGMPGDMAGPGMGKKKNKKGNTEESMPGPGSGSMARMPGMGGYGAFGGGPTDRYPESFVGFEVQDPSNTIARYLPTITIMAVVPIQKQTEEFDKKLSNSLDYDPKRDQPFYIDYRVQRSDVTDLDPKAEIPAERWQNMPRPDVVLNEMFGNEKTPGLYAGLPPEVVDPLYLPTTMNPDFYNHPAPPYLKRDLWDLLTHPDVPLASFAAYAETAAGAATSTAPKADDDAPVGPATRPGMGGGEGGMPGPGMRPGMPGGGMPGGGMPGSGMRAGGMPGGSMPGGSMPGGFRPGAMRGGEDSYGGYGANMPTYTPPKYQLIRYTDMRVEPGKKYRYRMMVYLHDPNHPNLAWGYVQPSSASLHADVRKRLKPIDEADAAKGKDQNGFPIRRYWITSKWSDPSPVAEVPRPERVYALKVLPSPVQKIRGVDVPTTEPGAHVEAVVFDPTKGADIPAENDKATRGSLLNWTPTEVIKIIHPVSNELVEMDQKGKDKYPINTNILVADLMGGERIKSVTALPTPLSTIGEMLIVDANGRLHVQDEAHDIEYVRRFTVPKEEKKPKTTTDNVGGLEGGAPGGRPPRRAAD